MRARAALLAAVLLAAGGLSSCGYSSGLRVSEKHSSVGVEFFGNESYERDLERPLDDEVTRAIRDISDAPIVASSKAEVVVRGRIRGYIHRGGIRSRENVLLETGVTIEVEATLVDRQSGKVIKGPVRAISSVGYSTGHLASDFETEDRPPQRVTEQSVNEGVARDRALRHIAEELVLDLFASG